MDCCVERSSPGLHSFDQQQQQQQNRDPRAPFYVHTHLQTNEMPHEIFCIYKRIHTISIIKIYGFRIIIMLMIIPFYSPNYTSFLGIWVWIPTRLYIWEAQSQSQCGLSLKYIYIYIYNAMVTGILQCCTIKLNVLTPINCWPRNRIISN